MTITLLLTGAAGQDKSRTLFISELTEPNPPVSGAKTQREAPTREYRAQWLNLKESISIPTDVYLM
jgi:hypothetical protein